MKVMLICVQAKHRSTLPYHERQVTASDQEDKTHGKPTEPIDIT